MWKDECDLITGKVVTINYKRLGWILKKWQKKGWWDGRTLTQEGKRICELVYAKKSMIDELDGRVVIVHYNIGVPPTCGIIEDCGDNGYYFYTRRTNWWFDPNEVSHVELHPAPAKLWRKLNYFFWKKEGTPDRFHKKEYDWRYDRSQLPCLPSCGCNFLQ